MGPPISTHCASIHAGTKVACSNNSANKLNINCVHERAYIICICTIMYGIINYFYYRRLWLYRIASHTCRSNFRLRIRQHTVKLLTKERTQNPSKSQLHQEPLSVLINKLCPGEQVWFSDDITPLMHREHDMCRLNALIVSTEQRYIFIRVNSTILYGAHGLSPQCMSKIYPTGSGKPFMLTIRIWRAAQWNRHGWGGGWVGGGVVIAMFARVKRDRVHKCHKVWE